MYIYIYDWWEHFFTLPFGTPRRISWPVKFYRAEFRNPTVWNPQLFIVQYLVWKHASKHDMFLRTLHGYYFGVQQCANVALSIAWRLTSNLSYHKLSLNYLQRILILFQHLRRHVSETVKFQMYLPLLKKHVPGQFKVSFPKITSHPAIFVLHSCYHLRGWGPGEASRNVSSPGLCRSSQLKDRNAGTRLIWVKA